MNETTLRKNDASNMSGKTNTGKTIAWWAVLFSMAPLV